MSSSKTTSIKEVTLISMSSDRRERKFMLGPVAVALRSAKRGWHSTRSNPIPSGTVRPLRLILLAFAMQHFDQFQGFLFHGDDQRVDPTTKKSVKIQSRNCDR